MIRDSLLFLLFASNLSAQTIDATYLRDHAQTRGFLSGRPVQAEPTPDGKAVLFLRGGPRSGKLSLYEFDVASKKTRELLSPQQLFQGEEKLSPEEKARRERMRLSAAGFATYKLSPDGKLVLLPFAGKLFVFDRTTQQSRELKTAPGALLDPRFAPDGSMIAFVRDHDVYVYHLKNNKEARVTTGGSEILSHGLAEFIAQEEMDRFAGYWWSPDSRSIAYQESNAKGVEVWHVSDASQPGQTPTPFYYPRPGKANVDVKLGVVPIAGGATKWVAWDREKYPYLATVRWPKEGPLLVLVQTRDQVEVSLQQVDPQTGESKTLLTEKVKPWVNLHQDMPIWWPGKGFLWISEIDDSAVIERRGASGRRNGVLADFNVLRAVSFDPEKDELFYLAGEDPTESQLRRSAVKLGEPITLSTEPGMHTASVSANHQIYVLNCRPKKGMPKTTVHHADGTLIGALPSVAEDPPFEPRVHYLKVGEGADGLHTAAVFPRKFDAKKKYPVLVDVYGGPHHLHVAAVAQRWLLNQWYADQGFIVVAIDGRGTPGRGRKWERAIYQKFGSVPLEDQVAGLKELGDAYPNMDLGRVGVTGWSFGGYMAALMVMRRPDVFHAGSAGAPVCDWLDYDTHYTERYLGVPPQANAAYDEGSLLTYAKELKRPLMIVHGTADDNVYFRHSLRLAEALFKHGKDFELVPLSGLTHMVSSSSSMERLHERVARFMRKHLGEPK